ncbi:unnamed protein product [Prorocentrum cordatum]|uniref:Uncharacterized protein n=1 Tax=Prorocentrum cordatum TaxID=2364126 RepID=A0ABN9RYR3_9DINO|nr:unnamed protein product [Polarella glacialis]
MRPLTQTGGEQAIAGRNWPTSRCQGTPQRREDEEERGGGGGGGGGGGQRRRRKKCLNTLLQRSPGTKTSTPKGGGGQRAPAVPEDAPGANHPRRTIARPPKAPRTNCFWTAVLVRNGAWLWKASTDTQFPG